MYPCYRIVAILAHLQQEQQEDHHEEGGFQYFELFFFTLALALSGLKS